MLKRWSGPSRWPATLVLLLAIVGCPDTANAPPAGTPLVTAVTLFDDVPARHPDSGEVIYGGVVRELTYEPDPDFRGTDVVLSEEASVSGVDVHLSGNAWPSAMQIWVCPEKIAFDEDEDVFGPECDEAERVRLRQVLGADVVTGDEALDRGFYFEDREIEPGGAEGTAAWRLVLYLPRELRITPGGPPERSFLEVRNVSLNDDLTGDEKRRSFFLSLD